MHGVCVVLDVCIMCPGRSLRESVLVEVNKKRIAGEENVCIV